MPAVFVHSCPLCRQRFTREAESREHVCPMRLPPEPARSVSTLLAPLVEAQVDEAERDELRRV
jgi:reverse gyrase